MKAIYYVRVDRYDYFKGHSWIEKYEFSTIKEAWDCREKQKTYDFIYDDAWHLTDDEIHKYWSTEVEKTGRSGHKKYPNKPRTVTKKYRKRLLEFDQEEKDFLIGLADDFNPDDEDVMI